MSALNQLIAQGGSGDGDGNSLLRNLYLGAQLGKASREADRETALAQLMPKALAGDKGALASLAATSPEGYGRVMSGLKAGAEMDRDNFKTYVGMLGPALLGADTPEKFDATVDLFSKVNPQLAQYRGRFDMRDALVNATRSTEDAFKSGSYYGQGGAQTMPGFLAHLAGVEGTKEWAGVGPANAKSAFNADMDVNTAWRKPHDVAPGASVVNLGGMPGNPAAPSFSTGGRGPIPTPGGGFAGAVSQRESGGNPNAMNPNSTAVGEHQFLEGTWLEQLPKHAPGIVQSVAGPNADLNNPETRAALLDLRRDPDVSKAVTEGYARENATHLGKFGIEPTPANLIVAHFLGGAGAARFLKANPNAPAASVVSPDAVQANRNVFFDKDTGRPYTVGELRQKAEQAAAGGEQGGQPPQAAPRQAAPGGQTPGVVYQSPQPAPGSQEGKFKAGLGDLQADAVKGWHSEASNASGTLRLVDQMEAAMQNGLRTGWGAGTSAEAARVLQGMGVPASVATSFLASPANTAAFNNSSNQMVLAIVKGLGPNPSNADREFIEATVPKLRDTPEAVQALTKFLRGKAQDGVDRYHLGKAHIDRGGDPLDFDVAWQRRETREMDGQRFVKLGGQWYKLGDR